ncbi:MAG: HAMP domain-containing histidine kinase [Deltaproteobacteria bacterium]|nr:HAMP domain-containing histidine kinase [Deltaproteobacteria bacterium]
MPALKRARKSQEQLATREDVARSPSVLPRLLDEVALPLDEIVQLGQRMLDGSGGKLSLEQRKWAEAISSTAARSAQRLRDYVDFMLLEAGELVLRPKVHNLDADIDEAVRQLREAARARGLHLAIEPAVRPLPAVCADPARVVQVLSCLVANAIKFTERGRVTVSTEIYDRSIAVHVVDTGAGIAATQIPRLVEDFFQGEGAKLRDPASCGLGLTLGRRLVNRIGGDLWATSTVGVGSKFSFTVPRAPGVAVQSHLASV